MLVDEYLDGPEDLTRRELVWGVVRDEPAPLFEHQSVIGRLYLLLESHVRRGGVGTVIVSPIDVVLDERQALVVQPDLVFVQKSRESIIRGQIWGSPDLVVEVASRRTMLHDRTTKIAWYRQYGVCECWLVHPDRRDVGVVDLSAEGKAAFSWFSGDQRVQSKVLPTFDVQAREIFE